MNVSEGRDLEALDAIATACGDVAHRRALRRRPQPLRVHPRGARSARCGARDARRSPTAVAAHVSIAEHDGVHPFLGALDVVPFVALGGERADATDGGARVRLVLGRDLRRSRVLLRRRGPRRSHPARRPQGRVPIAPTRPRACGAPSDARRHGRGRAAAAGRDQRRARHDRRRRRAPDRTRDARARRRVARSARARPDARDEGAAPGVDEPRGPRPNRDRGGVPRGARRAAGSRRPRSPRSSSSASCRDAELDRCSDEFLQWAGLGPDAAIEARIARPRGAGHPAGADEATPARLLARGRDRGGRGRAGGGCGDAHARTCRPRSRTSLRGARRTRGTRT